MAHWINSVENYFSMCSFKLNKIIYIYGSEFGISSISKLPHGFILPQESFPDI